MRGGDWKARCPLVFVTAHYDFHYRPNSCAAREIEAIAEQQEACYRKIVAALGVMPDFRIQYYLLDTPEEVGEVYGDNEPCNGFADMPDAVFAVYNDAVKCIGPHEDTHLISYVPGRPPVAFLREGLAMYMDEVWWGRPNEEWVREFMADGRYVVVDRLLEDDAFYGLSDAITYPIAGAFTRFMAGRMTLQRYLAEIYWARPVPLERLRGLDAAFQQWLRAH